MAGIFRANVAGIEGKKVAEISDSTENRTVNASQAYGVDGVLGQNIGADEVKFSFSTVTSVLGMEIPIDDLIGVPITVSNIRNGRMLLSDGVIMSSDYASNSKEGTAVGKFEFIGGAPYFA